jgi:hypothetical protein
VTLPASFRWAVTIATLIGFQIALSAAFELKAAIDVDTPAGSEGQLSGTGWSPEQQREVFLAQRSGFQSAIHAMLPWRIGTEALLALGAGAVFFLALRLRAATEGRGETAELVGRAALAAAILRTIDGAQNLVIARTIAEHTSAAMAKGDAESRTVATFAVSGITVLSVAWSLVVVGLFMGVSTYFRSKQLREVLDRAPET